MASRIPGKNQVLRGMEQDQSAEQRLRGNRNRAYFTGTLAKLAEIVRRATVRLSKRLIPTAKIFRQSITGWTTTAGSSDRYVLHRDDGGLDRRWVHHHEGLGGHHWGPSVPATSNGYRSWCRNDRSHQCIQDRSWRIRNGDVGYGKCDRFSIRQAPKRSQACTAYSTDS